MTPSSLPGTEKTGMPCSPDFILIMCKLITLYKGNLLISLWKSNVHKAYETNFGPSAHDCTEAMSIKNNSNWVSATFSLTVGSVTLY